MSVVVERIAGIPIPTPSERVIVGYLGAIIQGNGAPVPSSFEYRVGGVVVVPVVIVGIVVVTVTAANSGRSIAILFYDGKVEGNDDGNGNDNNTDGDCTNDYLAFRFVGRGVSRTFLLEVSVPRGGCPCDEVRIMGIVSVRNR